MFRAMFNFQGVSHVKKKETHIYQVYFVLVGTIGMVVSS